MKRIVLLMIAGLILAGVALPAQRPVEAQAQNYLTNPDFEAGFATYDPEPDIPDCPAGICTTAQIPVGWLPWWVSQQPGDPEWKNRMPEYKPAEAPFLNRVQSGQRASQYFTFYGTHTAGLWQRATVPANARVVFTIWGQAWSNNDDAPTSVFPTAVNMRIGIDPTGGANPFSPNVVWSGSANPYDAYAQFQVEATAQGATVTVFTWSAPVEQRKHNDIYWDAASLVVGGAGSPPPPSSGGDGGGTTVVLPPPAPAGPTPTPNADGVIIVEVRSGDSLWAIAARAGLTLDELLELNDLDRNDFISIGDLLIIGYGEPGGGEPEEDVEAGAPEAAGGETPAEEAATATPPPPPTATPAPEASSICLRAFDDADRNGSYDSGEAVREAIAFTIYTGQQVVSNYVTTGAETEPYCIEGLAPGSYRITRSVLPDEVLTTPGDWGISLVAGQPVSVDFGGYIDAAPALAAADAARSTAAGDAVANDASGALESSDSGGSSNLLVYAVVGLAVVLLIGVVFVILSARRSAA
jgi:hypothetical protein